MGAFRLNGRRLRPRYPVKCVNPVARVATVSNIRDVSLVPDHALRKMLGAAQVMPIFWKRGTILTMTSIKACGDGLGGSSIPNDLIWKQRTKLSLGRCGQRRGNIGSGSFSECCRSAIRDLRP